MKDVPKGFGSVVGGALYPAPTHAGLLERSNPSLILGFLDDVCRNTPYREITRASAKEHLLAFLQANGEVAPLIRELFELVWAQVLATPELSAFYAPILVALCGYKKEGESFSAWTVPEGTLRALDIRTWLNTSDLPVILAVDSCPIFDGEGESAHPEAEFVPVEGKFCSSCAAPLGTLKEVPAIFPVQQGVSIFTRDIDGLIAAIKADEIDITGSLTEHLVERNEQDVAGRVEFVPGDWLVCNNPDCPGRRKPTEEELRRIGLELGQIILLGGPEG